MSEKKSIWHQPLFATKKSKTYLVIVLGIFFLSLATLVWANQTGKISLWASTTRTVTNNNLTAVTTCANGMQTDTLRVNPGIGISACKCTYYTRLGNSAEWSTISQCQNLLRDQQCVWGPADSLSRSFSAQCNCTGGQRHGPVQVASCSVSPTTSPAPTTTPSTTCTTSSTDPNVCINAFTLNLNQNCNNKTNQLTWNLGSNPWDKYEWVTVQRRTGSGTFTLGSPQINQRPITSTWPCNSSGQCSHTDTFSDGSTNYTYRVYVKNKADGKTYRSYETYANSCGSVTPVPTPANESPVLNKIQSTCVSGYPTVGRQRNTLSWQKGTPYSGYTFYYYQPYVKSSVTNNQWSATNSTIYKESTLTHEEFYPSYDNVSYKIQTKYVNSTGAGRYADSNEMIAQNLNCPAETPTSSPTPTPTVTPPSECESGQFKCEGTKVYGCDATTDTPGGPVYFKWAYRIDCTQYGDGTECMQTYCGITPTPSPTLTPTSSPTASPTVSPTPPPSPINLTATPISNSSIKLAWNKLEGSSVGYYRIYNAESGVLIAQVDMNTLSFVIDGLNCETNYGYYVTAGYEELESNPSNTASVNTGKCSTGQDISDKKPENIELVYNGGGMATLTWDAVDGAVGYDIFDCTGKYITSTSDTGYVFTGLNCDVEICYYVIAHNAAGEKSMKSDEVKVSTESCSITTSIKDGSSLGTLVSTGSALWFNILLAILLTGGFAYLIFRKDIWEKK